MNMISVLWHLVSIFSFYQFSTSFNNPGCSSQHFPLPSHRIWPPCLSYGRTWCNLKIGEKLKNHTLVPSNPIFFRNKNNRPMSYPSNIGLSLEDWRAQCGTKFDWYHDVGPRLLTWRFPVILLIGNMQLAMLGKSVHYSRSSFFWAIPLIFTKLEIWNRCYDTTESLARIGGKNVDHVRNYTCSYL